MITGHTGFKGSWLTAWLLSLGAEITGISLPEDNENSLFNLIIQGQSIQDLRVDIRNHQKLKEKILNIKPDFIFHLAAQALVNESYAKPVETWSTNCIGTINLLDSARELTKCVVIIITSDKCYENNEWVWGYRENDKLGGADPYSASKAAAELAFKSYFKSYFSNKSESGIRIASVRAGNVIGGGDWSPNRIIPDCVKAWSKNEVVKLRNPDSTRPWQHVLEPLSGYLNLASNLFHGSKLNGESFNFGPSANDNFSVKDLVTEMSNYWDSVKWTQITNRNNDIHESTLLKLSCDKAFNYLNWRSVLSFKQTVKMTSEWYRNFYEKTSSIGEYTFNQIKEYQIIADEKRII